MDHKLYYKLPDTKNELEYLLPGESIVWQCTNMENFQNNILSHTIHDQSDFSVTYICFQSDPRFNLPKDNARFYHLDVSEGLESFTYQVFNIISAAPANTIFLFDCISELNIVWASDMMMANFICIICPIISKRQCFGFFPLLRNRHSYESISSVIKADIKLVDVKQDGGKFHIQSATIDTLKEMIAKDNTDVWHRYFSTLHKLSEENLQSAVELEKVCNRIMTQETQMKTLITKHFSAADYLSIYKRLIGTGKIGGKACGFLLGRKLIDKYVPDARNHITEQDSYFIGTDVFYGYMVENDCWPLRLKQRLEEEHFNEIEEYRERLTHGLFSPAIEKQLMEMLIHYGDTPIIVRSSSFLEDGYGNAFSGKYESIFCPNTGSMEDRLATLEKAIRTVYASTISDAALAYRKKRNLLGQDEQMALLIQKVSGTKNGDYYFPLAAGVSFSFNPYRWMAQINPKAGMIRLVAGLGTRAVNRTPDDYPRLVSLDRPQALLWPTTRERHRFSQRRVDALNLTTGSVESRQWNEIIDLLPPNQRKLLLSHDTEAEDRLKEQGRFREVCYVDCQGIINNGKYLELMKQILSTLEEQYQCPVDIEFALSLKTDGDIAIDLLQCRPLVQNKDQIISIQKYPDEKIIFDITQVSMRSTKKNNINRVVLVDPWNYYHTPYTDKGIIAAVIGRLNGLFAGENALLLVPGRIGTSSPELGVPVNYTEVSNFKAICEVEYSKAGYNPELSYGSHMFQDLVEADILYAAIKENRSTRVYQPELLKAYHNVLGDLLPDYETYKNTIAVYDLSGQPAVLYLDATTGHAMCALSLE